MIYVASRVHHAPMWRELRGGGWPISATWIDHAGEGETPDMVAMWPTILAEVKAASVLVMLVVPADLPLKGALVEVGAALGADKRVFVAAPGVVLEPRSMRPLGSWLHHPLVTTYTIPSSAALECALGMAVASS